MNIAQTGDALRFLAQHGQSRAREVARAVAWPPRTAGPKMRSLELQGLVHRVVVKTRTRERHEWVLTDKGSDMATRWIGSER